MPMLNVPPSRASVEARGKNTVPAFESARVTESSAHLPRLVVASLAVRRIIKSDSERSHIPVPYSFEIGDVRAEVHHASPKITVFINHRACVPRYADRFNLCVLQV